MHTYEDLCFSIMDIATELNIEDYYVDPMRKHKYKATATTTQYHNYMTIGFNTSVGKPYKSFKYILVPYEWNLIKTDDDYYNSFISKLKQKVIKLLINPENILS